MSDQTRCTVRSCCWRGLCPTHAHQINDYVPNASDHLMRQRPDSRGRGGGKQVQCRCGRWIALDNARAHLIACDGELYS